MILTDTHSHLYLKEFKDDLDEVMRNAAESGVKYIFLPNIDSSSIDDLKSVSNAYPDHCFPMMGLHPTSVKAGFEEELMVIEEQFQNDTFCAVGEIGIDLYWDKTFVKEQEAVFRKQVAMAMDMNLPVVIHSRNSIDMLIEILTLMNIDGLKGVFHCFPGNILHAEKVIDMGFKIGIGGVLTFKNSGLQKVVEQTDLQHILLETDAPFLAPVPYRGKRNESAYIRIIAEKVAEIKNLTLEEVAEVTTNNALELFNTTGKEHRAKSIE
jgi:TatD DNase family protein